MLNLLYEHQYTIIDWPAGVDAVGPSFNVKSLSADELRALTVPFLKEQMGADYYAEGPGEDDEGTGQVVPTPKSSFYLQHWTTGEFSRVQMITSNPNLDHSEQSQLFRRADPEMFNIPLVVNTHNQPLRLLSDSQKFLSGVPKHMLPPKPQERASSTSSLPPSSPPADEGLSPTEPSQLPARRRGSMNATGIRRTCRPSPAAPRHSTPPSSPTAHSPPPLARGRAPSRMSSTSRLPAVQHTRRFTPSPHCHQNAAHTRRSCSPTPRPQHRNRLQSHKRRREYQDNGSDGSAQAQGRAHHRYVVILAYIRCLMNNSVIEYVYREPPRKRRHDYDSDNEDYHSRDRYVRY